MTSQSLTYGRRNGADQQHYLDENSHGCNQQHIDILHYHSTYLDAVSGGRPSHCHRYKGVDLT